MLACRAQRFGERKAATERVSVGVLVPEDEDLIVRVNELFDLVVAARGGALCRGYFEPPSASSSGRTSFNSLLM